MTETAPRHLYFVFYDATPGNDAALTAWYEGSHIPEVMRSSRVFVRARRYALDDDASAGSPAPPRWRYLTVYEVDAEDVGDVHRGFSEHVRTVGLTPDGGTFARDYAAWVYTADAPGASVLADEDPLVLAFAERRPESVDGAAFSGAAHDRHQRPDQRPEWAFLIVARTQAEGVAGAAVWIYRPISPPIANGWW
jgi:hypothetical protein